MRRVVDEFREGKDSQKPDPNFKVLFSGRVTDGLVDFLEELDCRLPRLAILPHYSDADDFAGLSGAMEATAEVLRNHIIDSRFAITVERPLKSLDRMSDELSRLSGDPLTEKILKPFPQIEIPFTASADDPDRLVAAVADLWTRWPQLNDAVKVSRGGYAKHFYALKELWHLAQVMRQESVEDDLAALRASYGADEATTQAIARFDRSFLASQASFDSYNRWRYRNDNVVLEFDLDSIADTYECQSPVFIDNKWILEGGSLPTQTETVGPDDAGRAA